jgi:two-component system response regulator HydG
VIAATNKDPKTGRSQRFREDLFYRLNVINICLPSLRSAPPTCRLRHHFLRRYAEENAKPVDRIGDGALAQLVRHDWPGNVRELENVIERAVVMADGTAIEPLHLPPEIAATTKSSSVPVIPGSSMADIERHAILKTLEAMGGSTSKAADVLGISVRKIQYKLQEYGAAPKSRIPAVVSEPVSARSPVNEGH